MYCNHCEKEFPNDFKFCLVCGNPPSGVPQYSQPPPSPPPRYNAPPPQISPLTQTLQISESILILIMIIVVAGAAAGIGIAVSKRKKSSISRDSYKKPRVASTQEDTQFWVCPNCGNDTQMKDGRQYCSSCKIYLSI